MATGEVAQKDTAAKAVRLGADWLPELVAALRARGTVYGPVRKKSAFAFSPISSASDLALEYGTTILPPKKLLLRPMEVLFSVRLRDRGFEAHPDGGADKQVIFGLHSCDLSAITLLDRVYRQSYVDPVYGPRRDATLLVAMACVKPPHGNCFCASMGTGPAPKTGFDLLITPLSDGVLLESGSAAGHTLMAGIGWVEAPVDVEAEKARLAAECAGSMPKAMDASDLPRVMNENFDHPYWSKLQQQCLACANCSMSCPSCYCYNILDRVGLDTSQVQRTRTWDACLLQEFAEVHGGNFRKEREARVKQFVMHKLSYWMDQHGALGCVGCGRCIGACPAGIDITRTVAEIRGEVR